MKAEEKVLILLEKLYRTGRLESHDRELQERLEIGPKQLLRDIRSLAEHFEGIVETREGRRIVHRLVESIDILGEAYRRGTGLGMLWQMAREGMPELLEEFNRIGERVPKPYLFFNMPYEEIESLERNPAFVSLKKAIENREYRDITLKGRDPKRFEAVKPVKLLFSEGNWYIAYLDGEVLRISRISFIDKVSYTRGKTRYRQGEIDAAERWLRSEFQNSFSRYGAPKKRARLRAAPRIAHYFRPGMKRFLPSQRFVGEESDGSVIVEVDYTQEMEILPFIRRWLPDLTILSPDSLRKTYRVQLLEALEGLD
ncbi:helix-turn-helix transcriptional regulator [Nitratifractor sp.]